MSIRANDSRTESADRVRVQLLGRSIAALFWLVIVLLTCASVSVFSA